LRLAAASFVIVPDISSLANFAADLKKLTKQAGDAAHLADIALSRCRQARIAGAQADLLW
jgi:hypothetical protein